MLSANFKPKRTAAASRGFLVTARRVLVFKSIEAKFLSGTNIAHKQQHRNLLICSERNSRIYSNWRSVRTAIKADELVRWKTSGDRRLPSCRPRRRRSVNYSSSSSLRWCRQPTESIQRRVTSPAGCSDCSDDVNGECQSNSERVVSNLRISRVAQLTGVVGQAAGLVVALAVCRPGWFPDSWTLRSTVA